jgi:NAD(P)-dependent dehydrogenase (short-subunit alcohol dehydrogenase family)
MSRVVVTGAGGGVGRAVMRHLSALGDRAALLARGEVGFWSVRRRRSKLKPARR